MSGAAGAVFDRTLIDWLTITSDDGRALHDCLRGPVEYLRNGPRTYHRTERDGYGTVFCAGGPEGGRFMLQMGGQALAAWRAERDQRDLVAHLASSGARCTRIDLARDTSGDFTPTRLREFLATGRYVSLWRKPPLYTETQDGPLSVYLGSRKSAFMLRVYDKKGEMLAREEPCPHDRLTRWEEEIKDELADHALRYLWSEPEVITGETGDVTGDKRWPIHRLHAAWLSQRLRLTTEPVRRASKEQSRAETDPAWGDFVSESSGSELVADEDNRSHANMATELAKSLVTGYAGAFSTVIELAGPGGIEELLRRGEQKRSAKHRILIAHRIETMPAVRAVLRLPDAKH